LQILIMLALLLGGGELVLRNGQKISYQDTYEIKDDHVHFRDQRGDLYKLPLAIVDLARTEALAEARKTVAVEAEPVAPRLTPFEKFVAEATQTEDGEGGELILLQPDQTVGPRSVPGSTTVGTSSSDTSETATTSGSQAAEGSPENAPVTPVAATPCDDLRSKLAVVRRQLDEKERDLKREQGREKPSARKVSRLTEAIDKTKGYADDLARQLAECR